MNREEFQKARKAVREKMMTFMSGAFAFVAALAWNEAIKDLIDTFVPSANGVVAKLLYAVGITIVVALVLYIIERPKEEEKQR